MKRAAGLCSPCKPLAKTNCPAHDDGPDDDARLLADEAQQEATARAVSAEGRDGQHREGRVHARDGAQDGQAHSGRGDRDHDGGDGGDDGRAAAPAEAGDQPEAAERTEQRADEQDQHGTRDAVGGRVRGHQHVESASCTGVLMASAMAGGGVARGLREACRCLR